MGTAIGDLVVSESIELSSLKNKIIAVDSHNILYQFLSSIRGPDGMPLMNSQGTVTSHLAGLLYRTSSLVKEGISPVFVFDGKPHELKTSTLEKRREIRTKAKEQLKEAVESGDLAKARSIGSRAVELTRDMIEEAKKAVEVLGFPVVQGKQEGEAQATFLVQKNLAFATATQDYDALLLGCPVVIRNMAITGKRKLPYRNAYITIEPQRIELEKVLKYNNLTRKQLVWIGMLVGTDYNEKIPLVGPKTALKLVKNKKSFDDVLLSAQKQVDYDWRKVEELFLHPAVNDINEIPQTEMDREKAMEFFTEKHGFDSKRVSNALDKIQKVPEDKSQQTLGSWS
jgi:flap endonuclease-1